MKVLMVSQTADGLGIAQRLVLEGNEVKVWVKNPEYHRSGEGIVTRVPRWQNHLQWADFIIFDMVGMGKWEQVLRKLGKPFIGCSSMMDMMELDREKGMDLFRKVGIDIPETWGFGTIEEAKATISSQDFGDGFVLKPNGNIGTAMTLVVKTPEELAWAWGEYKDGQGMVVQRVVKGVEVSTEGWFNGEDWIKPFNHTFEEKRFMEGDLGPNTGCMGNVVLARESNRLTKATVERLKPFLKRIGWRGPVDVNCIVNAKGAYALEATARFGYDAIETLCEGLQEPFGAFLLAVAKGDKKEMALTTDSIICVRLTVPPYPLEDVKQKEWGQPIWGINTSNIAHIFLCNVFLDRKANLFKVADADGLVLKVTARGLKKGGDYVGHARDRAYRTLKNLKVSGQQYRLDIGKRVNDDMKRLVEWGWVQP